MNASDEPNGITPLDMNFEQQDGIATKFDTELSPVRANEGDGMIQQMSVSSQIDYMLQSD